MNRNPLPTPRRRRWGNVANVEVLPIPITNWNWKLKLATLATMATFNNFHNFTFYKETTMKTLTTTKRTTRRLAASIAIATALATSSAWAAYVWTGAGNGYWGNSSNFNSHGDTGASGMFFRTGVIDNTSGNEIVVVSNDVHFDTTRLFGYNFYVDRGTSLEVPATLAADTDAYGITVSSGLNVGTAGSDYGDGYLWIKNGTYSFNSVTLGQNAGTPASGGYLTIGSPDHATTFTSTGNFQIHNGEVTTENATVTVNGNLVMNDVNGSTATFYNRGGNMVVTNDLTVQNRGSGEFYMEGGHVTVSNIVRFGDYTVPSGGIANLYLNGGVFEAKTFRFHNGSTGYVVLNGGTYKAMADGSIASTEGRVGAVKGLFFKVGERGGTIHTAGHDVIFPLRLLQDGSSTGGLFVKGGGSLTLENSNVTYAGKTCVEAGTTLVVSNSTVKSNILSHGLELVGAPTVGTPYTVFVCNDDLDAETDLANVTCGAASDFTKAVGTDGKSIVVTVTALKSGYWTGAKDNNLSDPANWSDGIVPTSGTAEIYCPVATALTVGDTFAPSTITIPDESAVVTLGAGDLHLSGSLTNAMKLAVGAGASLTVDGDLVLYKASGTALYSNEGTVIVKGDVDFHVAASSNSTYYQYEVVTDATTPIMAGGLAYNGPNNYLTVYLGKNTDSPRAGQWVIGSNGLHYKSSRNIWHTGFMMGQGVTTLYSSSDWSLASSGRSNSTRDLGNYYNTSTDIPNSSLVLDTNNYTNNAVSHTITLNGRLISSATTDPAVTIKGAGTVVVNTSEGVGRDGYTKSLIGTTLAVTDTATLKINAGKSIVGEGKVSLAAGTTLVLTADSKDFTPCIPGLALPTEGTATIRIDGARLKSGDHVIATVASGTTENVTLDLSGTALDGRKGTLRVENGKLFLSIVPDGLMIIFR